MLSYRLMWLGGAASLACTIASFGFASMAGCSSDDPASDGDASAESGPPANVDLCNEFTSVGEGCAPVSNQVCFPLCANGGCFCRAGQDGKGIWSCTTDLTCFPDASPLEDADEPEVDAGPTDASNDARDADASG